MSHVCHKGISRGFKIFKRGSHVIECFGKLSDLIVASDGNTNIEFSASEFFGCLPKLMPEAVGQLNMYLNYYATEVNDSDDNPPIGIILCTEKNSIDAEYALGGLSNNLFASKYVLYIPNKEQLIAEVEKVLENWHKRNGNE